MLELWGKIYISGTKSCIEKCAAIAPIPNGIIMQLGLKQKVPDTDSWLYQTPLYRFRSDTLDDEIRDFLTAHSHIRDGLYACDTEIKYAFFTIVPVANDPDHSFSTIFRRETLKLLTDIGLELEIAPENLMPDAPYWKPEKN